MFESLKPNGKCTGCPADVHWTEMVTGGKNPLNLHPDPEKGNIAVKNGRGRTLKKDELEEARAKGAVLYTSHFMDCPNRDKFRKPKKAKAKA